MVLVSVVFLKNMKDGDAVSPRSGCRVSAASVIPGCLACLLLIKSHFKSPLSIHDGLLYDKNLKCSRVEV